MLLYVAIIFEALLFGFFVLLTFFYFKRSRSVGLLQRLTKRYAKENRRRNRTENFLRKFFVLVNRASKPLDKLNFVKKLEFRLKQAGIPLLGAEFIVITFLSSVVGSAIIYMMTLNIFAVPTTFFGVILVFWFWVKYSIGRRKKLFTEQLGDCLTTVANALRAGYSFQQAMDVIAREMEPPMSSEFERVTADIAMGVTLEEALEQMNTRVESSDFELVVTAVLIQREVGGNLAQILDTISDTINERIRMKREINALTAQGRMSANVLLLLPFAVAAFTWTFNHDQMMMLFEEQVGRIAVAVSVVMEIFGFFVIRRIVDIEL